MNEIKDNPPPLPEPLHEITLNTGWTRVRIRSDEQIREVDSAAFARGVAAGQTEIDRLKAELGSLPEAQAEMLSTIKELRHINKNLVAAYEKEQEDNDVLRAKIKQMEEQEPVAISHTMEALVRGELTTEIKYHASFLKPVPAGTKLYASPGAKP